MATTASLTAKNDMIDAGGFKSKPSAGLEIAERIHSMAQEQDDPTLMIVVYTLLAGTHYYLGDLGTAHQYMTRGVQVWRSGGVESHAGARRLGYASPRA
jgi:hypothetical protein